MKIVILANSSRGVYAFRNELVLKMLEENEVIISVPDDVSIAELQAEGCKIIHTPMNRRGMNPIEDLKVIKSYRKLLKAEKPDVVLTYTIKPNVYGGFVCKRMHIPYFVTITGLGSTFQKQGILKNIVTKLYQIGLSKAECVFFQNVQNKELFENLHISGKKSKLVSGSGVNLTQHALRPYPKSNMTRFLFVGRIMREKGIDEFLEAASRLHSEHVIFEILGYCDEDYQDRLDSLARAGVVTVHGFHKDVDTFLAQSSALVLPTYHEGMSNVLMEASACGRPVIASNISGCKEIFDDGVTGFGFAPQNSESLITALERFLCLTVEEREQMGMDARKKMEREFNRDLVVQDYMEEINRFKSK